MVLAELPGNLFARGREFLLPKSKPRVPSIVTDIGVSENALTQSVATVIDTAEVAPQPLTDVIKNYESRWQLLSGQENRKKRYELFTEFWTEVTPVMKKGYGLS